jgi:hypothetical protein
VWNESLVTAIYHVQLAMPGGAERTEPTRSTRECVVQDLEAARTVLISAGFDVVDDIQLQGFERFYISDPFDNWIEILAPARRQAA